MFAGSVLIRDQMSQTFFNDITGPAILVALRRDGMKAVEALALVGGHVDEELLKRNEYLAAENEILRSKLEGRINLTNGERTRLAKLGHELGRKALEGVAAIVKPETILAWFRNLVARSSTARRIAPRPDALEHQKRSKRSS